MLEARYLDAPVAVKEGACSSEIEMHLAAGLHDNIVSLRGLTQKVWGGGSQEAAVCNKPCLGSKRMATGAYSIS